MAKTWTLRSSLWVPHTPEAVFPFFAEAENLETLTPPWLSFRILTPRPIPMHQGVTIDYRIALHGLPMRWRTLISRYEPGKVFVDEQLRGPYAIWRHTHTFAAQDGGTLLGDEVVMRPKGGPLAPFVFAWFVRRDVERIFQFRLEKMAELFGGKAAFGSVTWDDGNVPQRNQRDGAAANAHSSAAR